MNRISHTSHNLARRKHRIRSVVSGTTERPRLSVHISNKHVTAQIIDDTKHVTLVYVTSAGRKQNLTTNMTDRATQIGAEVGKLAKTAKIKRVVFDRNGRLYHGRIKALAEAARAEGLEF